MLGHSDDDAAGRRCTQSLTHIAHERVALGPHSMANLHSSLSILDSILASLRHLYRDFQRVRADTADLLRSAPTLTAQRGQCGTLLTSP